MDIVVLVMLLILFFVIIDPKIIIEGYQNDSGKYCHDCNKKTINECLECFNCGLCTNSCGQLKCVRGDHTGPWNRKCKLWHHRDPYSYMIDRNLRETKSCI